MTQQQIAQIAQWSHEGKDGSAELLINLADDPDDNSSTTILVRGRERADVARRLAELLNEQAFTGA